MNPVIVVLLAIIGLINAQCSYYTIQPGDTYDSIARRYGTSITAIQQSNPSLNANNLQVGQQVCVPNGYNAYNGYNTYNGAYPTYNSYNPSCNNYYVRAGDTCASLSQGSISTFYQVNPNINCNNLQVGQAICVPWGTQSTSGTYYPAYGCNGSRTWTVQPGDTCWSIAQRFGTSVESVQSCIGVNCSNLQVGQVLRF